MVERPGSFTTSNRLAPEGPVQLRQPPGTPLTRPQRDEAPAPPTRRPSHPSRAIQREPRTPAHVEHTRRPGQKTSEGFLGPGQCHPAVCRGAQTAVLVDRLAARTASRREPVRGSTWSQTPCVPLEQPGAGIWESHWQSMRGSQSSCTLVQPLVGPRSGHRPHGPQVCWAVGRVASHRHQSG